MGWSPGESPQLTRELSLYDVSFLMTCWGGSLSLEQALARVGISFLSWQRWTADPARYLPPGAQIKYPLDSSQVAA